MVKVLLAECVRYSGYSLSVLHKHWLHAVSCLEDQICQGKRVVKYTDRARHRPEIWVDLTSTQTNCQNVTYGGRDVLIRFFKLLRFPAWFCIPSSSEKWSTLKGKKLFPMETFSPLLE